MQFLTRDVPTTCPSIKIIKRTIFHLNAHLIERTISIDIRAYFGIRKVHLVVMEPAGTQISRVDINNVLSKPKTFVTRPMASVNSPKFKRHGAII
nr:hypothetical protein [uncultured Acidovorax sp.]